MKFIYIEFNMYMENYAFIIKSNYERNYHILISINYLTN